MTKKFIRPIIFGTLLLPAATAFAFTGETVDPGVTKNIQTTAEQAAVEESGDTALLNQDSKWRVYPGLTFNTIYDSNINREQGGARNEDIIFQTKPSIRLNREGGVISFDSGYEAGYDRYVRDDQQPNIFSHKADMSLKVLLSRLRLTIDEDFLHDKTYASSEQSERRTLTVNRLGGEAAYDLTDRTAVAAILKNDVFRYGETVVKEDSYLTNQYGGRVYYRATASYDAFFESGYFENRYYRSTSEKNSDGFWAGLGIKGALSPRAAVNLAAGFKHRAYSSSQYENDANVYAEGGLRYRLTSRVNATFLVKRDLQESLSAAAAAYRANRASLDFKYQITEFINLYLGGFIQRNEYINNNNAAGRRAGDRKDWLTGGRFGCEWEPIEHFFINANYEYSLRTSTNDSQDGYTRHVVTTGLAYKFK